MFVATRSVTLGRSAASKLASASMNATISAVAVVSPAKQADPKPGRSSVTTRAPCARATAAVVSVEPLSTTIAR